MTRVAIHQSESGAVEVFADGGVTVFWVDERTPDDRVYRLAPGAIPEGMLDGEVGFAGDASAAETRAHRLGRLLDGSDPLDVIDGGR